MATIIITALIILAAIYGGYSYYKKLRFGGGCCGEREAAEKKVKVADKDKSHYPYTAFLKIDGMTCSNCVRRVENALNRLDGVWATIQLEQNTALVRMKQPLDDQILRSAVREQGYTVLSIERG